MVAFADIHIGREQGDDPTKFYLLDPYIITTGSPAPKQGLASTTAMGGSGTLEVGGGGGGGKGNAKRHVGSAKKAVSGGAQGVAESHGDGECVDCLLLWTPSNPATLGTSQSVLIRGVTSFQGWICTIQWTPSNPATLGTSQSVPTRGVASLQGPRFNEFTVLLFFNWTTASGGKRSSL